MWSPFFILMNRDAYQSSDQDFLNFNLVLMIIFIFAIIDITIILIPIQFSVSIPSPSMELRYTDLSSDGTMIVLKYNLKNLSILDVKLCILSFHNMTEKCNGKVENDEVIVFVPRYVYSYIYRYSNSTLEYLGLSINITLDKGFNIWQGTYPINWKRLEVYSFNNGTIKVFNPNFIAFNLTNIEIWHYQSIYLPPIIVKLGNMTVNPKETITIIADHINDLTYIRFQYSYKFHPGGIVYESRQVSP